MDKKNLNDEFEKALHIHNQGDLTQAESIYKKILINSPNHDGALHGLGLIAFSKNSLKKAAQLIKKAILINPKKNNYHANLGNILYEARNFSEAIKEYKKVLKNDRDNSLIHNNLGHAYQANSQINNAISSYKNAIRNNTNNLEYRFNLAVCLQKSGEFSLAKKEYTMMIKENPNNPQIHHNLGILYLENNKAEKAIKYFEECIKLNPSYALAYNSMGSAAAKNGNTKKAIEQYKKAIEIDPNYFEAIINLANLYELSNTQEKINKYFKISKIIKLYKNALTINKNHEKTLNSIACAYESIGDVKKSKKYFKKLLSINPNNIEANYNYTRLIDKKYYDNKYIRNLEKLISNNANETKIFLLFFSLAHIYDKKGEYKKAEYNFTYANNLKDKNNNYNKKKIKITALEIIDSYTEELYRQFKNKNIKQTIKPIFILGMPRSGTSLIEQIISNHEEVHGAGEIIKMAKIEDTYKNKFAKNKKYPSSIKFINDKIIEELSNDYTQYLTSLNSKVKIFTDKLPGNFIRIGFIKLLFPNAKIIHCKRHPLDNCLSIFFTNFSDKIDYSFNLDNIANYYLSYTKIMNHWKKIFNNDFYEICYESLIMEPEKNIRDFFEYCELDWNEKLLDHLNNKRPVQTASVMQVRKPIYKTSVRRAKNYKEITKKILSISDFKLLSENYNF